MHWGIWTICNFIWIVPNTAAISPNIMVYSSVLNEPFCCKSYLQSIEITVRQIEKLYGNIISEWRHEVFEWVFANAFFVMEKSSFFVDRVYICLFGCSSRIDINGVNRCRFCISSVVQVSALLTDVQTQAAWLYTVLSLKRHGHAAAK